MESEGLEHL